MVGGEEGGQHIGVVLDLIQVEAVFVIAGVQFGVVVNLILQIGLQRGVARLRPQHILIPAGVGTAAASPQQGLGQDGTGGHGVEKQHHHEKQRQDNEKSPLVPDDKSSRFPALLRRPSQGVGNALCRRFERTLRSLAGPPCLGVLPFDGLFLLPAGERVAAQLRVVPEGLPVEGVHLRPLRRPVLTQLTGAVGVSGQISAALGGLLQPVGGFHTHVLVLRLADLPVKLGGNHQAGSIPDGVGQLGGRLGPVFLKMKLTFPFGGTLAGVDFAGFFLSSAVFLFDHAAFQLFPAFRRRCVPGPGGGAVRLPLLGPVVFLQTAPVLLGLGELEAGAALNRHSRSPASPYCPGGPSRHETPHPPHSGWRPAWSRRSWS